MEYVASKPFHILACVAIASLGYPLLRARQTDKGTSLRHTLNWAILAWGAWLATYVAEILDMPGRPVHYVFLCFCACTAVAVLGARFPGMAAWNFVVCGLLAVLSLPLLQQRWHAADWRLEGVWAGLLGVILAVGVLNYPPSTGIGGMVIALAILLAFELRYVVGVDKIGKDWQRGLAILSFVVAVQAWASYRFMARSPKGLSDFDATWRHFRNRYGRVWAWRVRDQFNNAASHKGWKVHLTWRGLEADAGQSPPTAAEREVMLQTLQAVLQRFGLAHQPEA